MNILVTGGAGYIGSHTCKALHDQGHTPVAYDNLTYGHPWAVKWGPFERGDVADTAKVLETLKKYGCEAVVHFAAFSYVGESVQKPDVYYKNNVGGTLSLLLAMNEAAVKNIVFSSTCATFGGPITIPMNEKHPQNPISPYGRTKLIIEQMLKDFTTSLGFSAAILRYFNAAGADPSCDIGEDHDPETHLIPIALKMAAEGKGAVTIFGDDYDTPDGTCVRDYIHVTDLANAHIAALDYIRNHKVRGLYDDFNLGNGKGFSVKEVISRAEKITGKVIRQTIGPRRPGDPPVLVGDSRKAEEKLGWKTAYSNLDTIIETAWKWHLKHQNQR